MTLSAGLALRRCARLTGPRHRPSASTAAAISAPPPGYGEQGGGTPAWITERRRRLHLLGGHPSDRSAPDLPAGRDAARPRGLAYEEARLKAINNGSLVGANYQGKPMCVNPSNRNY